MRTWRQGVVGKITLPGLETLHVKCLKYPLALFYDRYSPETLLFGNELFRAFLRLDSLGHIERVGSVKLTPAELELGNHFALRHTAGTTEIATILFDPEEMKYSLLHRGALCSIEDLRHRRP